MEQIKTLQENIQKKVQPVCFVRPRLLLNNLSQIKDLQAAKSKIPFKNVADVDAHIKYVLCV